MDICVVFGGKSSEHDVSLASASSVIKNLIGYNVIKIGITKTGEWIYYEGEDLRTWRGEGEKVLVHPDGYFVVNNKKITFDVIFPVLHGLNGEDGTIQGLFEICNMKYVGCGVLSSALAMDKVYTKKILENTGILQADYEVGLREENIPNIVKRVEKKFSYPVFVKPSNAGSSIGISKVLNKRELNTALELAFKYDRKVLIEEFINGREIECAVLGNLEPLASCVGEIVPGDDFYSYDAKYNNENSRLIIPAVIDNPEKVQENAVKVFKALDCRGLARVDFFLEKTTGKLYFNEINTMPGFTDISMYAKLFNESGISYSALLTKLIEFAKER